MSRNAISANPEHNLFKIFRGACPRTPLKGLKKFFSPLRGSEIFLRSTFLQTKIVDNRNCGKRYEHVVKLFIDLKYRVSQKNFNCLISCQLKTTVFTRYVFMFSKFPSFNLNCGINQSKSSSSNGYRNLNFRNPLMTDDVIFSENCLGTSEVFL